MTPKYVMRVFKRWDRREGWKHIGNAVANFHLVIPLFIAFFLELLFEKLAEFFKAASVLIERNKNVWQPFKYGKHRSIAFRAMQKVYQKAKKKEEKRRDKTTE